MSTLLPRLGHIQRKQYIEENYGLYTNIEMALACRVNERTIRRDIQAWKTSGEYDEWLDARWHEYLEDQDISKTEKFRALTRLKEKRRVERNRTRLSQPQQEAKRGLGSDLITTLTKYQSVIDALTQTHVGETSSTDLE